MDDLSETIKENSEESAFRLATYYLSFKSRTEHEIKTYLAKKGYEDTTVDKVLEKLSYYGFTDDRQYAINYIANAIEAKKKSADTVKLELMKRGISSEIIEDCIPVFSYDINLETAKRIGKKYFYRKSNLPYKQLKNKLSQLLAQRRFTREIIDDCLNYLDRDEQIQSIVISNQEQYQSQAVKLAEEYFFRYTRKENNPYLLRQKIKHALYRKGYDMDIINSAVEEILNKS
ncbi:MAG: RecX family transcriptional regulator [Alkaliphilus sp.]|nr:RecX family transcriptional regulator [Alkaliphilus sp.]